MPRKWPSWICRPGRARSSCAAAVTPTTCRAAISSTRRPARCGRCRSTWPVWRRAARRCRSSLTWSRQSTAAWTPWWRATARWPTCRGRVAGDAAHARVGGPPGPRDADPGAAARVSPSRAVTRWHARRGVRQRSGARPLALGSGPHDAHPPHVRRLVLISIQVWTPDGRRLIFSSERAGARNLFWQAADGTGAVERLTESPNTQYADGGVARRPPADLHRDGSENGRGRDADGVGRDPSRHAARAVPVHRAERDRLARRPLARLRGE